MLYANDTFALYEDLFKEAHDGLLKEGRVGALRRGIARLFNPEAERAAARSAARVKDLEDLVDPIAEAVTKGRFDKALRLRQMDNLAKELEVLKVRPGALTEAQQAAASAKRGRNIALGVGGVGVGAGVPAAYLAGQSQGTADKTRTRNIAFGAGAAAGLAAPTMIRGLGGIARSAGQMGVFPELEGLGTTGGYY